MTTICLSEHIIPDQPPENDSGNREYKYKIIPDSLFNRHKRCAHLATQLNFRLTEGNGKALYLIGVHDGGTALGIDAMSLLMSLSMLIEAATHIKKTNINAIRFYKGRDGYIATVRLSNPTATEVW